MTKPELDAASLQLLEELEADNPEYAVLLAPVYAQGGIVDFEVRYANPATVSLYPGAPAALVGRRLLELDPGLRERGTFDTYVRVLQTGRAQQDHARYSGPQGELTYRSKLIPLRGLLLARFRDVTRELQAEAELRASRDELQEVLENTTDAFYALDRQWRFTAVNRHAERFLGMSRDQMLGRRMDECLPAASPEILWHMRRAQADGVPLSCEAYSPLMHTWVEVHVYPGPRGLSVYFRDIGARRQVALALEESEARHRALTTATFDALVLHAEGLIVEANHNAAQLLGVQAPEELVGQPVERFIAPEALGPLRERLRARSEARHELTVLRADGARVEVEAATKQFPYRGRPVMSAALRDVTERRQLEAARQRLLEQEQSARREAEALAQARTRELLSAQEKLVQSEKLAAAGQLAAGVGHEINNPLAFVMGNLDFALSALQGSPAPATSSPASLTEVHQALSEAREGADRIRRIVADLKLFSRADESALVPVDLHAALEFSLSMAMPQLRHRALVERSYGEPPRVCANEGRLSQVFLNLLVNAAHALPEGSASEHRVRILTRREGGSAVVEISDTGCGMSPEVLERAFEPFFTTKAVGAGTGLGLSICHGIVRGLGGTLSATSTKGQGATFRVVLPAWEGAAAGEPARAPARATAPSARRRVLVVDDEPGIAHLLQRIIGREHEVVVAHSGRSALELLARDPGFDRIFCDLMMPDGTGMDVHAQLAERQPELLGRVVFMTGGDFTARSRAFLQQPALVRIEKPFQPELVRQLVHQAAPRGGEA
ncbi:MULTISPECIES: PAS domain S-box protein [Myxococcaceae]|uniref:PAS domain S-box protein n=1 Tax=Myxococcaceae TaxID=31 RepID=UPI00129C7454|nr:PAS domain S-box protein [Simulacricoccus sp. 17bor-14]